MMLFRLFIFALILSPGYPVTSIAQPQTFDVRVPSEVAGSEGLYCRVTLPLQPRYGGRGAPVIIYVQGGFSSGGANISGARLGEHGFIEIRFNFPGGGRGATKSGGTYDDRGENCLKALRDVARFAMGEISNLDGKYLGDLTGSITPMYSNVGLAGMSNGGNATIVAAGLHADSLSKLAWIVNWESPVGDGMVGAEAGAKPRPGNPNPVTNPAYNPDDGTWDLTTVAYSDTLTAGLDVTTSPPTRLRGGLYFDINGNNVPDRGTDFIPNPLVRETGGGIRAFYSVRVTTAAYDRGLVPSSPPAHIATVQETRDYWRLRNGEYWIDEAVSSIPGLMFLVVASEQDHVQTALDHPHVLIQYEGFRSEGARFVRLNPDRSYVEYISGRSVPGAVDNDAFAVFDHLSIRTAVEPSGTSGIPTYILVAAAACELADRTSSGNLAPQLDGILLSASGATAPVMLRLDRNYPNPFGSASPFTIIRFNLPPDGYRNADFKIIDALGRTILHRKGSNLLPGENSVTLNGAELSDGIYIARLVWNGQALSRAMLLVR
ncbi:MAG: T9SS type A sorting domain-containing protein [Chlorobi bacterium]|nr:T9SS type A sorting domain-containing protein [Chlorobiota bacterium]